MKVIPSIIIFASNLIIITVICIVFWFVPIIPPPPSTTQSTHNSINGEISYHIVGSSTYIESVIDASWFSAKRDIIQCKVSIPSANINETNVYPGYVSTTTLDEYNYVNTRSFTNIQVASDASPDKRMVVELKLNTMGDADRSDATITKTKKYTVAEVPFGTPQDFFVTPSDIYITRDVAGKTVLIQMSAFGLSAGKNLSLRLKIGTDEYTEIAYIEQDGTETLKEGVVTLFKGQTLSLFFEGTLIYEKKITSKIIGVVCSPLTLQFI